MAPSLGLGDTPLISPSLWSFLCLYGRGEGEQAADIQKYMYAHVHMEELRHTVAIVKP